MKPYLYEYVCKQTVCAHCPAHYCLISMEGDPVVMVIDRAELMTDGRGHRAERVRVITVSLSNIFQY